jgi:hypothetical protein
VGSKNARLPASVAIEDAGPVNTARTKMKKRIANPDAGVPIGYLR